LHHCILNRDRRTDISMNASTTISHLSNKIANPEHSRFIFDDQLEAAFFYMQPEPRPCFTTQLLSELEQFQKIVSEHISLDISRKLDPRYKYTVMASNIPDVFNLGGDLNLFLDHIKRGNRDALQKYAVACINAGYKMCTSLDLPLTTIALIQGSAQGGGFEAALSCNTIIAEKGSLMGFPEVLFNLFPGMGAYSYLRQRVNSVLAENIILSGKIYCAEELHKLGIVDVIAEPGQGKQALREYIRRSNRKSNANALIRHTRNKYNQVTYEELHDITSMWVDCALSVGEREIKTIDRLIRAQNRKMQAAPQATQQEEA